MTLLLAVPGQSALAVPGTVSVYSEVCYAFEADDVIGSSIGIVDLGGNDVYFLYSDAEGGPADWELISPSPDAVAKFRRGRLEFQVVYGTPQLTKIGGTITKNALLITELSSDGWSGASPKKPLRLPKVKLPQRWPACH